MAGFIVGRVVCSGWKEEIDNREISCLRKFNISRERFVMLNACHRMPPQATADRAPKGRAVDWMERHSLNLLFYFSM